MAIPAHGDNPLIRLGGPLWHSWDVFAEAQVSRSCGWTRRSLATLCVWVVLLVVEASARVMRDWIIALLVNMSSVGLVAKRHSMLHALLYTMWVAPHPGCGFQIRLDKSGPPWFSAAGTFLGLARLLTSATSFEDALDMAAWMLSYPWQSFAALMKQSFWYTLTMR